MMMLSHSTIGNSLCQYFITINNEEIIHYKYTEINIAMIAVALDVRANAFVMVNEIRLVAITCCKQVDVPAFCTYGQYVMLNSRAAASCHSSREAELQSFKACIFLRSTV